MRFRFIHVCTCIFITTNQWHNWINEVFKLKYSNLITNCFEFAYWRVSIIFTFAAICNKLFKIKLPQEFESIWGLFRHQSWSFRTLLQIALTAFFFWRFSMIFAFTAICNKLLELKLPQEFQSICTCISVTTNKRTELDSSDIKVEVFRLYYKLRWLRFLAIWMIFAFTAICNKLFKLKLLKEFQSICTCIFVTTNKRTELDSSDIKVEVFELYYKFRWLRFFGDFRWFSHLPQFVINFSNLNCPRSFKVYVPVSSIQLIRGLNLTVQTSKLKFLNFITNCVDCVFGDFRWFLHLPQFVISFSNLNCPRSFKVYVPVSSFQLIWGLNLTD